MLEVCLLRADLTRRRTADSNNSSKNKMKIKIKNEKNTRAASDYSIYSGVVLSSAIVAH